MADERPFGGIVTVVKAVFWCGGDMYEVQVASKQEAAVVCDLLTLKAAIDGQLEISSSDLHSTLLPSLSDEQLRTRLLEAQDSELRRASFPTLVQELQESVGDFACRVEQEQFSAGTFSGSLLHAATSLGHTAAAQLILVADPEAMQWTDYTGLTPLHEAALKGHTDTCTTLLAVAPQAVMVAADGHYSGMLPLHCAAREGYTNTCEALLDRAPGAAMVADADGRLPLHFAAREGYTATCEVLLDCAPGAATKADRFDELPLHCAAEQGHTAACGVLLDSAPEAAMAVNFMGALPLHLAAQRGHTGTCEALLYSAPQAATMVNSIDALPLHCAARQGHTGTCEALLAAASGAAMVADADGRLPLHLAAREGYTATCEVLLDSAPHAALVAAVDGWLPLHFAAQQGHAATCTTLLDSAPEAAMVAEADGWLPLHGAAGNGHAATVAVLAAAAPETAMMIVEGTTPLQLALQHAVAGFGEEHTLAAACCLLSFGPGPFVLTCILQSGAAALPLLPDFVTARLPLTAFEWRLVPTPCPGLLRTLPAALAHSTRQAQPLVQHLPPADIQRLRLIMLSLHRAQRQRRVLLPPDLLRVLYGLSLTE